MQKRALAWSAIVTAISCGQGLPNVGLSLVGSEDADVAPHDAASGIRILSDVTAPPAADARSATMRDATLRDRDGDSASEGVGGAAADVAVMPESGVDAAARRDATSADAANTDATSHDGVTVDATRSDRTSDDAGGDVTGGEADANIVDATQIDSARSTVDVCVDDCTASADHLLISEVATRPSGAEMIEITNPTRLPVDLADYLLSDSHLYYKVTTNEFTTASGSDFAARFPSGSIIMPGQYLVVAIGNASGGTVSFEASYGKKPDFELRPTANGATDDASVPNMSPAQPAPSIGATSSLTDGGEPIVLFFYRSGSLVSDVDYLYFGAPTSSNPAVVKTDVVVAGSPYHNDTPAEAQHGLPAPAEGGSLQRCGYREPDESSAGGNGLTGHDETSEDTSKVFVLSSAASDRTPGGPSPASLCTR